MEIKYTPELIEELQEDEIFVFGSNELGSHAGGAARIANEKFGAVWGVSSGPTGRCYAIPTLDKYGERVESVMLEIYLEDFIQYVRKYPSLRFYLTKIGCGIAGWSIEEVRDLLWKAVGKSSLPKNLIIPREFDKP